MESKISQNSLKIFLVSETCSLIQACAQYETLIIHVIPGLVLLMFLHLVEEILLCYLTLFSQVYLFRYNAKEPQGKYMHLAECA
jgi:hypothetical protein